MPRSGSADGGASSATLACWGRLLALHLLQVLRVPLHAAKGACALLQGHGWSLGSAATATSWLDGPEASGQRVAAAEGCCACAIWRRRRGRAAARSFPAAACAAGI